MIILAPFKFYDELELSRHFTGRAELLAILKRKLLEDPDTIEAPRIIVLHGPGGIGKSQLALKYAATCENDYHIIFKVDCSDQTTVEKGLAELAANVLPPDPTQTGSVLYQLLRFLGRCPHKWLLLFDSYDKAFSGASENDYFPLLKYFPVSVNGHIIVTSRLRDASKLGTAIVVPTMSSEEAVELLVKSSNTQPGKVLHSSLRDICYDLDFIPLAINIAGNYMREEQIGPAEYLERCAQSKDDFQVDLIRSQQSDHPKYIHTVYKVWMMSLIAIERVDRGASSLLLLLTLLDPSAIVCETAYIRSACLTRARWRPDGLLRIMNASDTGLPQWLVELVGKQNLMPDGRLPISSALFNRSIALLINYSLLRKGVSIIDQYEWLATHSLFRTAARIYCNESRGPELVSCALNLLFCNATFVLQDTNLHDPEKVITEDSVGEADIFLSSGLFTPFKDIADHPHTWKHIGKSLAAAYSLDQFVNHQFNLEEPKNMVATVAVLVSTYCKNGSLTPSDSVSCYITAMELHKSQGVLDTTRLIWWYYRMHYVLLGRGMPASSQNRKILTPGDLAEILHVVRKIDLAYYADDIWFLCFFSHVLVMMSRIMRFNEEDDSPCLYTEDSEIQGLRSSWLSIRHTKLLRKYSRVTASSIDSKKGCELLLRARTRLFLEFAADLDGIPIFAFYGPTVSKLNDDIKKRKMVADIIFIMLAAVADLELLNIYHLCLVEAPLYLCLDYAGLIPRLVTTTIKSHAPSQKAWDLEKESASLCLKRPFKATGLDMVINGAIDRRTYTTCQNCNGCRRLWDFRGLIMTHSLDKEEQAKIDDLWLQSARKEFDALVKNTLHLLEFARKSLSALLEQDPADFLSEAHYERTQALALDAILSILDIRRAKVLGIVLRSPQAQQNSMAERYKSRGVPPNRIAKFKELESEYNARYAENVTAITNMLTAKGISLPMFHSRRQRSNSLPDLTDVTKPDISLHFTHYGKPPVAPIDIATVIQGNWDERRRNNQHTFWQSIRAFEKGFVDILGKKSEQIQRSLGGASLGVMPWSYDVQNSRALQSLWAKQAARYFQIQLMGYDLAILERTFKIHCMKRIWTFNSRSTLIYRANLIAGHPGSLDELWK
jgi:hypothetical protein